MKRPSLTSDPPLPLIEGGELSPPERAVARLLAQLPERPPDELAARRIWRQLAAERSAPRRWGAIMTWTAGAAGAALALVLTVAVAIGWRGSPARLEIASGVVLTAAPRGNWLPTRGGAALAEATRLRTGTHARALLSLMRAELIVDANSDVGLESLRENTFLRLAGGELIAEVNPRRAGEAFVIQTTRYRVTVKGTIFSVREAAPDDVTVSVSRGLVEVSGEGASWQVAAGRSWNSRSTANQTADTISERDRQSLRHELDLGAVAPEPAPGSRADHSAPPLTQVPQIPTTTASPSAFAARVLPPQRSSLAADKPTAPPIGKTFPQATAPVAPTVAAPGAMPSVPVTIPQPVTRLAAAPAATTTRQPPTPPAPIPAVRPPDVYADAVALTRSGHYQAAAAALEQVVREHREHADLALYDLSRLRMTHLGDAPGALAALRSYEAEYPHGPLSQEVELSAIELTLASQDLDEALAQMSRYLTEHGQSERAPQISFLRGNVLRERGDCEHAIKAYRRAAVRPSTGLVADDGMYFTAFCEQQLGRGTAAADTLRAYLRRFPDGRHAAEARAALGTL